MLTAVLLVVLLVVEIQQLSLSLVPQQSGLAVDIAHELALVAAFE